VKETGKETYMREKISAKATGTQTCIHEQRLAKEIRTKFM